LSKPWHRDVPARVSEYLDTGGLWNPELMDHEAVRKILIDARDVIEIIARERSALETRTEWPGPYGLCADSQPHIPQPGSDPLMCGRCKNDLV
jgi:hypothetical protein